MQMGLLFREPDNNNRRLLYSEWPNRGDAGAKKEKKHNISYLKTKKERENFYFRKKMVHRCP